MTEPLADGFAAVNADTDNRTLTLEFTITLRLPARITRRIEFWRCKRGRHDWTAGPWHRTEDGRAMEQVCECNVCGLRDNYRVPFTAGRTS